MHLSPSSVNAQRIIKIHRSNVFTKVDLLKANSDLEKLKSPKSRYILYQHTSELLKCASGAL